MPFGGGMVLKAGQKKEKGRRRNKERKLEKGSSVYTELTLAHREKREIIHFIEGGGGEGR